MQTVRKQAPRERYCKSGIKFGFINDSAVWLTMLKKRNSSFYIYDEDSADEMMLLIRDSFIPAFSELKDILEKKLDELEDQ